MKDTKVCRKKGMIRVAGRCVPKNIQLYVVTAIDKTHPSIRVPITIPMTKGRAEKFKKDKIKEQKISIPKYRFFKNMRIKRYRGEIYGQY